MDSLDTPGLFDEDYALQAHGDRVGVEPFSGRRLATEVAPALRVAGSGLIGLRVVIAGAGFAPGDVVYLSSQDSVLPWAVERFNIGDQSFILCPRANIKLFQRRRAGVEPLTPLDIQGGMTEKKR